jgi:hypothetical protein
MRVARIPKEWLKNTWFNSGLILLFPMDFVPNGMESGVKFD